MRTPRFSLAALAIAAALFGSACAFDQNGNIILPGNTDLGPTGGSGGLTGLWTSGGPISADSCSNFQWNITTQTTTSLAGNFSALCASVVTITGTASGQLSGQNVTMQVDGIATVQGVTTTCGFSLSGNGVLEGSDAMRVNYTGTTCLGPVSGTELLQR